MNRLLRIAAPVLVVLAGVVIARVIIAAKPTAEAVAPVVVAPAVRVIEVSPTTHTFVIDAQGTVAPRTEIPLVAEVAGRVVRTSPAFENGGFFAKGEVLLEIDPIDYRLALTRAEAEVAQAELNLSVQRADAEVARAEWKRLDEGEPPPLVARTPQVAQAEAALAAAKAAVASARRDLDRTRISAPFEGRVRTASVDAGQVVGRGAVLGSIYAIDYAEIDLPLATRELAFVRLPMGYRDGGADGGSGAEAAASSPRVDIHVDIAGARHTWEGTIVRTGGAIDPTSRRLNVTARIDDPYGRNGDDPDRPPLAVGLFVDAEIHGREVEQVFVVPRATVRADDVVLVVDDEDRLRLRAVHVVRRTRDRAVIDRGLVAGERVVISTMEAPVDGMRVRPHVGAAVAGGEG